MRVLPPAVTAVLGNRVQYLAVFAVLETDAGTLRLWSGVGDRLYEAETYTGAGDLLAFGSAEVGTDLRAAAMTVQLSGIPSEHLTRAILERVTRKLLRIDLAWLAGPGGTVLGGMIYWQGYGSSYGWSDDGKTATLTLEAEGRLIAADRPTRRSWTDQDQRSFVDAADGFFKGMAQLQDKDFGHWGAEE